MAIACVCMWRRKLVVGGGNRLGDARRAPTYAVRKLRACVCECVCAYAPAPLCRVPVCTTRLAFAGSNSAGRGTCCLARVCVRAFVFGFVLMQFLFSFRLILICYCLVLGKRRGWFESSSCCVPSNERVCVCVRVLRVPRGCCLVPCTSSLGSSAGRIVNVYTYTYTSVYVRIRTQAVSCAHVFVSVCVRTRQLLCVVCLFAPRASRLLGRIVLAVASAAWLACVCVPMFLVLC